MAWFKIDDLLPKHRKARKVLGSHQEKRRDVAPFGLWALAGAWSDDGFVPEAIIEDWDDDAHMLAHRLVDAGLWIRIEKDGEAGFLFHDWEAQNPASSAQSFSAHVRWHVNEGIVKDGCPHCPQEPDFTLTECDPCDGDADAYASHVIRNALPDPTRTRPVPVPTVVEVDQIEPTAKPAEPVEHVKAIEPVDRFEEFWTAFPRKVGKPKARNAWKTARRRADQQQIIDGALRYASDPNREDAFTAHPQTWLNRDGWDDPPLPARASPAGNRAQSDEAMFERQMQRALNAHSAPLKEIS